MRGASSNHGKISRMPLFLAVVLHLGVFMLALAAPHLTPRDIHPPEVFRVELFNAVAPSPAQAPSRPVAAVEVPAPKPTPPVTVVKSPARHILPPIKPLAAPAVKPLSKPLPKSAEKPLPKPAAVSLTPLKERLIKEKEAREHEELVRQKEKLNEQLQQIKLDLEVKRAEAQAHAATDKAIKAIADLYRTSQPRPAPPQDNTAPKPHGVAVGSGQASATPAASGSSQKENQAAIYGSRLIAHITPHWILPEHQNWNKNLKTTIAIKIKKDGTILSSWPEKYSGDFRFDKYAQKAIDRSAPLPPLPPELGKESETIFVTFTPGGLQ